MINICFRKLRNVDGYLFFIYNIFEGIIDELWVINWKNIEKMNDLVNR